MIGGESGDYILRIKGDSMKDAGILEGDYVVVHPSEIADDGEIVVAVIEDEATVKHFYRDADGRPPAAGERRLRADPHHRGARPRQGDRSVPEGLTLSATATSERPAFEVGRPATVRSAPRLFEPASNPADGPTLEDVVLGAWEELIGRGRAECPSARERCPAEGGCPDCGSELS